MADDLDIDGWEDLLVADTDELPVLDDDVLAALEAEIAAEEAEDKEEAEEKEHSGELAKVIEISPDVPAEAETSGEISGEKVVVHGRMRDRRIKVRREEGQRRLRRLTWALAGLVVLVDGAAFVQTSFVDVEKISIAGTENSDAGTVAWASGVDLGDATLTVDERAAERRIEALAWVASADVQKDWPSTVRVKVTERVPAAVLESNPGAPRALVDATGRILQIGRDMPPGLVTITGVPPVMREGEQLPEEARDALRIAVAAPVQVPGALTTVSTRLEATLTSGGRVRFGSVEDLDEKLTAVATALARVDLRGLCMLDVKVPRSPTVSRQPC